MKQKILQVNETKYSESFDDCSHCKHCKDTVEICVLRKCVHVIDELEDCYVPIGKESVKE